MVSKVAFFARKNMVKSVFKLTKSVRNYGEARNKNYVFFGDVWLTIVFRNESRLGIPFQV